MPLSRYPHADARYHYERDFDGYDVYSRDAGYLDTLPSRREAEHFIAEQEDADEALAAAEARRLAQADADNAEIELETLVGSMIGRAA